MQSLAGKVVLITGAARGQGRSRALRLAAVGARVAAVDIADSPPSIPYRGATAEDLVRTVELVGESGGEAIPIEADVRDQDAMDSAAASALSAFGSIDIVCANAGVVAGGPSWRLSEQQWRDVIDVNLTGVWHTPRPSYRR